MEILNPNQVRVEFDMAEVHDLSVEFLTLLEESGSDMGLGAASLALSLGRLLSPEAPMEVNKEIAFIQMILEYGGMFFAHGGVN